MKLRQIFHDNAVLWGLTGAGLLYSVLLITVPIASLIVILNGVFVGAMVAIIVAFHRLLLNALQGNEEYSRVRQMTLGFFLCWLAYALTVVASIYLRTSGVYVPSTGVVAASRFVAIVAAVLQVTAPDFGLGLFHGRDRKALWTGAALGLLVSCIVVYVQVETVLNFGRF